MFFGFPLLLILVLELFMLVSRIGCNYHREMHVGAVIADWNFISCVVGIWFLLVNGNGYRCYVSTSLAVIMGVGSVFIIAIHAELHGAFLRFMWNWACFCLPKFIWFNQIPKRKNKWLCNLVQTGKLITNELFVEFICK